MKIYKFYADWCGPCKLIEPLLKSFSNLPIESVDIEENMDLAYKYKVHSIPTLVIVHDNGEIEKLMGPREITKAKLKSLLKKNE
jgi:thioredoxin 1